MDGLDVEFVDLYGDGFLEQVDRDDEAVLPGLSFQEETLDAHERAVRHPDLHPLLQVGTRSDGHSLICQNLNCGDLLIGNRGRYPIVAEESNHTVGLQYLDPRLRLHGGPDEEIAREEGETDPLPAVHPPAPALDQRKKGLYLLLKKAAVGLLLVP